ncbi:hypothetical protein BFW38_11845 [Terasakiispira papahanaumokuakeensis]|uniref:Diguanylate cyclase n=1 Tax=Terasakiispira papahanaumokuakeensis TaxID=197479 RepID=A0A1E2VBS3_9GAMM|nr:diguanylate cyclase [Terasakiispira papahanaumokuakeensis]ODC04115.1 hypothetical protein BFW38_11845 [Terasakiispira papahanaumokuakeensis]
MSLLLRSLNRGTLGLIGFIWFLGICFIIIDSWQFKSTTRDYLRDLAHSVLAQYSQYFHHIDGQMLKLRHQLESPLHQPHQSVVAYWNDRLNNALNYMPEVASLSVINEQGHLIAATRISAQEGQQLDVSDRAYVKYHRLHPERDELFIAEPVVSRFNGRYLVMLTRRLALPDGQFGTLVAVLNARTISQQLGAFSQNTGILISLANQRGNVISHYPFRGEMLGGPLEEEPGFASVTRQSEDLGLTLSLSFPWTRVWHTFLVKMLLTAVIGGFASIGLLLLLKQVHRQYRQRESLEEEMKTILLLVQEGVIVIDLDGRIRFANDFAVQLTGYDRSFLLRGTFARLFEPGQEAFFQRLMAVVEAGQEGVFEDVPLQCHSGRTFQAYVRVNPLKKSQATSGAVLTLDDMTDFYQRQSDLEYRAHHDPLTQLANRRYLTDWLQKRMESARWVEHCPVLFYLDLDGFKPVNDEFGHAVGDQVLKVVAQRLQHLTSSRDLVARIGGDEFVMVMADGRHSMHVKQRAEQMLHALSQPIDIEAQTHQVGASIGVCAWQSDMVTVDAWLQVADHLMYEVKRSGKGHWLLAPNHQHDAEPSVLN